MVLLTLWSVQSLQDLSACTIHLYFQSPCGPYLLYRTSVHVQYSYASTPPVGRTASTVPQSLYSAAKLLTRVGLRDLTEPQCL